MKRIISMFLVWIIAVQAFAAPPFPEKMQKALNELVGASGRTYSSNGALDVLLDQYVPSRPAGMTPQQALDRVARNAMRFADRDSLVSMVCIVMDDNVKRSVTNGANIDTIRTALLSVGQTGRPIKWRIPVGMTIEPEAILHGDTTTAGTSTQLSKYDIANLVSTYGWDFYGTTGYDESAAWAHGVTGKIATGAFTSYDWWERNLATGISPVVLDSLGFFAIDPGYTARWMSWSNSSCTGPQKRILSRHGIEFGFSSNGLSTTGSASGERPNYLWPAISNMAMGVTSNERIACLPGMLPDRYEMMQCIAETSDSATVRKTIAKCVALRGSGIVINLHNFALWSTNLAGNNAGDLSTVSGVMSYLAKLQRQGRIRIVTPTEFGDNFYNRPIGPGANWLPRNFSDNDADGNVDMWVQRGTTATGFPNSATGVPTNATGALGTIATGGYGGTKEAPLRWSGVSKIGEPGTGYAKEPAGSARSQAWISASLSAVCIGPPRGWTAHIEFAARGDTTKAVSHVTTLGDSIGVSWTAVSLSGWNTKRQGQTPGFRYLRDMNNNFDPVSSWSAGNDPFSQPHLKLSGKDKVSGSKFARAEFEFEVPEFCDILYVSIWQGGRQESLSMRISDVSLSFRPRDPWRR